MTSSADIDRLAETARALVAPGQGILAADESAGTIKRRFDSIGVESTEDNRRNDREMLFTAEGAENYIKEKVRAEGVAPGKYYPPNDVLMAEWATVRKERGG